MNKLISLGLLVFIGTINGQTLQNRGEKQKLDSIVYVSVKNDGTQKNSFKYEYTYNFQEKLINELQFHFFSNDKLQFYINKCFSYDHDGRLAMELQLWWDYNINQWVNYKKYEYAYKDLVTTIAFYDWNTSSKMWETNYKDESYHEQSGKLLWNISYYLDDVLNDWLSYTKYEYSYNSNDKLTETTIYNWGGSQKWLNDYKLVYGYDAKLNQISYDGYAWNDITKLWEIMNKETRTFDTLGNVITSNNYSLENTAPDWEEVSLGEFQYDYNYTFNDLILPYHREAHNKLIRSVSYQKDQNIWKPQHIFTYYYSKLSTSTALEDQSSYVRISPNPVKDYFTCEFTNLTENVIFELLDLLGRKVFSKVICNNERVLVKDLLNGFYNYHLHSGEKNHTGKLIIAK